MVGDYPEESGAGYNNSRRSSENAGDDGSLVKGGYEPVASTSRSSQVPPGYNTSDSLHPGAVNNAAASGQTGRIRSSMACMLCRKQKMKCQGPPAPCKRCRQAKVNCVFEQAPDVKTKEETLESRTLELERRLTYMENQRVQQLEGRVAFLEAELTSYRRPPIQPSPNALFPPSQRRSPPSSASPGPSDRDTYGLPNFPLPSLKAGASYSTHTSRYAAPPPSGAYLPPPSDSFPSHRAIPPQSSEYPNSSFSRHHHTSSQTSTHSHSLSHRSDEDLAPSPKRSPSSLSHLLSNEDARSSERVRKAHEISQPDSLVDSERGGKIRRIDSEA